MVMYIVYVESKNGLEIVCQLKMKEKGIFILLRVYVVFYIGHLL